MFKIRSHEDSCSCNICVVGDKLQEYLDSSTPEQLRADADRVNKNRYFSLLDEYIKIEQELKRFKKQMFPEGTKVSVNSSTYKGKGLAVKSSEGLEELAVELENGNIWWYPIECCVPISCHENKNNPN